MIHLRRIERSAINSLVFKKESRDYHFRRFSSDIEILSKDYLDFEKCPLEDRMLLSWHGVRMINLTNYENYSEKYLMNAYTLVLTVQKIISTLTPTEITEVFSSQQKSHIKTTRPIGDDVLRYLLESSNNELKAFNLQASKIIKLTNNSSRSGCKNR